MKNMSLREFAKYAKVSPQRLSDLISEGKIKQLEGGLIPVSEYEFFVREELLKAVNRQKNSVLFLDVCPSEDAFLDISQKLETFYKDNTVKKVASIDELVREIYAESRNIMSEDADMVSSVVNQVYGAYKVEILKEFKKRIEDALVRHLSKACTIKEVAALPLVSIYEMLLFDSIQTDVGIPEETVREVLSKKYSFGKVTNSILGVMNTSFNSVITSLNIKDNAGKDLITRQSLTPDFWQAIDKVIANSPIKEGHPLYDFMKAEIQYGANPNRKSEGADAEKIKMKGLVGVCNLKKSCMIGSCVSDGFYTLRNITMETDFDEVQNLIKDINEGYYSSIIVLIDEEYAKANMRESLYIALQALKLSKRQNVEFTNEVDMRKFFCNK